MKALILCAGEGKRLGLKKTPKCMVKINKKPVLEYLVNHLNKYGITEIIVNLHVHPEKVMKHFGTKLMYFYEPKPLGREKTIELLKDKWLACEFIVMNGDTLTNINIKKMIRRFWYHQPCNFTNPLNNHHAGTMIYSQICKESQNPWDGDGAYYFDIGTPTGLRKARKFFKQDESSSFMPNL